MPRHRFDPVAFVFGAVFVAAGLIVLAGGELIDEGRALIPAGLIALGVALLVHVGRRGRPPAPAGAVAPHAPQVADDRDLDALFAPVDDALADWDRANAGATPADIAAPVTDATDDADVTDASDGTDVDSTDASDATDVDITEVDPSGTDATPTNPEVDVTEVVDPTERYPRREPE